MSIKLACSVVPTMEICPNCKSEMTITEVTPIFLADGVEDVTYRCKGCRLDIKRAFKPRCPMPRRRRSTRWCVRGQLMYSPRDQAVIDAEPVGAGVDSEAVEIFEF